MKINLNSCVTGILAGFSEVGQICVNQEKNI